MGCVNCKIHRDFKICAFRRRKEFSFHSLMSLIVLVKLFLLVQSCHYRDLAVQRMQYTLLYLLNSFTTLLEWCKIDLVGRRIWPMDSSMHERAKYWQSQLACGSGKIIMSCKIYNTHQAEVQ